MFTKFYPLTNESGEILSLFPEGTFFFPSNLDARNNMLGVGFIANWKSFEEFAPFKDDFFDFIEFVKRNIFIFISKNISFLEPVRILSLKPFIFNQKSIIYFGNYPFSGERWRVNHVEKCRYRGYISNFTKNLSPVKIMIATSSKMTEEEKMFLFIAVDEGFPYNPIGEILERQNVIQKWEEYLKFSTKPKKNIHKVARRSFLAFASENKTVIEKISENLIDPNNFGLPPNYPVTDCFLYLEKYLEEEGIILFGKRIPEMHVNKINCRAIFSVNAEETEKLVDEWNKVFNRMSLNFSVSCSLGRQYEKEKKRKRLAFNISSDFSFNPLEIYEVHFKLLFIENLIKNKLKELDQKSYLDFERKKRKEFWIKSVEISIEVPFKLLDEIGALTKDYFSDSIVFKKGQIFSRNEDMGSGWVKVSFELIFRQLGDFIIEKRKSGVFYDIDAEDTLTRVGIEYGMRKEYRNALKSLRMAKKAMEADLLVVKSTDANKKQRNELWKKAKIKYRIAGIDTKDFAGQPLYLKDKHPSEIYDCLERNYDWILGLQLFLKAEDRKKEALDLKYIDEDGYDRKLLGVKNYLKLAGIELYNDIITFEEGLSIYYTRILDLIQTRGLDLTKEWLGHAP